MKKLILIIVAVLTMTFTTNVGATMNKDLELVTKYNKKHFDMSKYKEVLISEKKLTNKKLRNRKKNKIIYVELLESKSKGKYGYTKEGTYIRYNKKVKKGKIVKSYLIYNPATKAIDDVVAVVDNRKIR